MPIDVKIIRRLYYFNISILSIDNFGAALSLIDGKKLNNLCPDNSFSYPVPLLKMDASQGARKSGPRIPGRNGRPSLYLL